MANYGGAAMKNSARGDSSTGSELKGVEEACREASRKVEPCEFCNAMVQDFRGLRKFLDDGATSKQHLT
jgi:hypothetical protein